MIEMLQKAEGENKGLTKDVNNLRAVITTLTSSLGEEGPKSIEDLKRQMVFFYLFFSIFLWRKTIKSYLLLVQT